MKYVLELYENSDTLETLLLREIPILLNLKFDNEEIFFQKKKIHINSVFGMSRNFKIFLEEKYSAFYNTTIKVGNKEDDCNTILIEILKVNVIKKGGKQQREESNNKINKNLLLNKIKENEEDKLRFFLLNESFN